MTARQEPSVQGLDNLQDRLTAHTSHTALRGEVVRIRSDPYALKACPLEFTKHMSELAERRKEEAKMLAVFPCVLKPLAVFNKKDPIVLGVDVAEGNLRTLTPICAVKVNAQGQREIIKLGRV